MKTENAAKFSLKWLLVVLMLCLPCMHASAELPVTDNNLQQSLKTFSHLVPLDSGYMRVFYQETAHRAGVEYYDDSFAFLSRKWIPMELKYWGGFYAGSDAYYLIEGQPNTEENDAKEVVRVIKYSFTWERLGAAVITGNPKLHYGEVRYPFDHGCVECTEKNGTLYIVTGHEGYVDPYIGQGHQGYLMIAVNESTMTGEIVDSDLWHSIAQYIASDESDLYVLEQSEGSRCTQLSRISAQNPADKTSIPVLKYGGTRDSVWSLPCYASVNGMAVSKNTVLCIGTSIDQALYHEVTSDTPHNIYLTVTPRNNFTEAATKTIWLTGYTSGGKYFYGVKLTKVNDDRFLISWEESEAFGKTDINDTLSGSVLHYVFVDGNGSRISQEYTAAATFSECQPVVKNGKISYYASNNHTLDFYSIGSEDAGFSKKVYHGAGENASWTLQGYTLTISGTGALNFGDIDVSRFPTSYTSFVTKRFIWDSISPYVGKIVIEPGITSIPEGAFTHFLYLEEVELPDGLLSIGKEAFAHNPSLEKIRIPGSVQEIGEDILWTGHWTENDAHEVTAAIYAPKNSAAAQYAAQNRITRYDISKFYPKKDDKKDPPKKNTASKSKQQVKRVSGLKIISRKTKGKKKTITLRWNKAANISGYELQYSTNSKFKKNVKKIWLGKKTSKKTITSLKKSSKYYFRIRAYRNTSGNRKYGKWNTGKVRG